LSPGLTPGGGKPAWLGPSRGGPFRDRRGGGGGRGARKEEKRGGGEGVGFNYGSRWPGKRGPRPLGVDPPGRGIFSGRAAGRAMAFGGKKWGTTTGERGGGGRACSGKTSKRGARFGPNRGGLCGRSGGGKKHAGGNQNDRGGESFGLFVLPQGDRPGCRPGGPPGGKTNPGRRGVWVVVLRGQKGAGPAGSLGSSRAGPLLLLNHPKNKPGRGCHLLYLPRGKKGGRVGER